ncbi:YaaC family protein [Jeotgalibacillus haloalkalitolerans]|uniref:YaaC family protein n=1 Tax=Jeotgalibacillus haloalkalitolerans TaxID=3104292 RepID=A0ABU5KSY1_9BACL|nr:YaaC family protein [Jeotgalibacillus sp. HH7-29]MDZ5713820.1 YaaC family protein [Jeotgalibacillus sp. HH7-29]
MTSDFNWNHYLPLYAKHYVIQHLYTAYSKENYAHPEQLATEKAASFSAHIEHAELFYQQSSHSTVYIQPVLQFYGLIHLLKAAITMKDPFHPEKSNQLAHGVSSRKIKKKQFSFLEDTVKIQKHGLYTTFSEKLLHCTPRTTTCDMQQLFKSLHEPYPSVHTLQAHYLILYNLSMLARYETEWWHRCMTYKETLDYPVIKSFLTDSAHQVPEEMMKFLLE